MKISRTFNVVEINTDDYPPKYHLYNFNDYRIEAYEIDKKALEIILGFKLQENARTCLIVQNTKETRARINEIYDTVILDDNPIIMLEYDNDNFFKGMKPRW